MKVALAGYGLAARVFHAPLIRAVAGLELAVVVSSDAAKVHADCPDVAVVGDFADVLRDPAIDLVVLATPDHVHAAQALAALDAGKHVVIDKPFAPTLGEARAVAAHALLRDRLLSVFHNRRWDADFLTLRALVDAGKLGEVVHFESHFDRYRPEIGERWKDRRAGGVWQDLGPHLVDQALQVLGRPDAVSADIAALKVGGEAPDHAHVVLHYPGRRAVLRISQSVPEHGLRFAVHGTRGSWIKHGIDPQEDQSKAGMAPGAPGWGVDARAGVLSRVQDGAVVAPAEVANLPGDYRSFYAGVRDAVATGAPMPVTAHEALAAMEVIEAALESQREGRRVAL